MTKEALKLALEALQKIYIAPEHEEYIRVWWPACEQAIPAIKEALAQPEQEPVAWYRDEDGIRIYYETKCWDDAIPLYTAPQPWEKFCDSNCVWTDHHPDCKLAEQEPVACDGDFPEGFDASLGVPAQALRVANAIMCDVIGKREWDVPCTAQHVLSFAQKYTIPPQDKPDYWPLDEWSEWREMVVVNLMRHGNIDKHFARRLAYFYQSKAPQRKPLTDEEVNKLVDDEDWYNDPHGFVRVIEAAHGIKGEA